MPSPQERGHQELHAGHPDTVNLAGSEMIDDHDMNGEEKGTAKHQQITGTHRKTFLYAKQIKSNQGYYDTGPDDRPYFFA